MHASAIAFIDILLFEYLSDILGIIIDDAGNLPGELRILLLQALHLLVLQQHDAIQQFMLIVPLIGLDILAKLYEIAVELLDLLPVLELLGHEVPHELLQIGRICFFRDEGQVLIVESEVAIDQLGEEKIVIVDE